MSKLLAAVEARDFLSGIKALENFVSRDTARYYLNGLFMHWRKDKGFYLVATDGHKLGRWRCELTKGVAQGGDEETGLICRHSLPMLKEWLQWYTRCVWKSVHSICIVIETEGQVFTVRGIGTGELYKISGEILDGQFPNYQKVLPVMPEEKPRMSTFNAEIMSSALAGFGKEGMDWFLSGQHEPSVARDADGKRLAVIMPMRM